jgi:membrane-associated phospholipid phosphatase
MASPTGPGSRCFRPLTALLLALAAFGALWGGFLLDAPVRGMVLAANGGHWSRDPFVAISSRYGDWPELMILGAIGVFTARRFRSIRWQRILLAAMISSTLSGMMVNASRLTTGRTRPRAEAQQGWYGPRHDGKWLVGQADFNSFPSGHTATAMGFAGVILFAAPAWGVPAAAGAAVVILSRILLGAHHPSDVVTASLIALAVSWAVWEFLGRRGRIDLPPGFPKARDQSR